MRAVELADVDVVEARLLEERHVAARERELRRPSRALEPRVHADAERRAGQLLPEPARRLLAGRGERHGHGRVAVDPALDVQDRLAVPREDEPLQPSSTRSIVTSSCGRSIPSRGSCEIVSTTSIPSVTFPKTVCLPSSQEAASAVTMKNWLPFVFGPGVRHRERAADDLVVVELVLELVAGAAAAGAGRIAALDHEVGDHAVEDDAVVEPVASRA